VLSSRRHVSKFYKIVPINRGALQDPFISALSENKNLVTLSSNSTFISAYNKNKLKKSALSFLGEKMVDHLSAKLKAC
jgi:hypothetical protein